ncbi:hypothetical protein PRK78_003873 [Emydomyces testavorans]|uniref:Yeast cell wall synthesis Kre9/Knh1-like N-terminal domain-containing protein n=1 Tax=Emydomyces testavorans TaxID=2070801 RepID=A0AAF0II28_9EURO|nr:hypothetical protein PRK78_003873 [Emydomyces testavorans]
MHFFKALLAGAALIASTAAQGKLAFTSFPSNVQVGKPVTVTWAGGSPTQPVTIKLRKGSSNNLQDVAVLTSAATGGSYTWTPSSSLINGPDYALQISQGSEINYTNLFSITGGSGSALPSSHATTTTLSESLSSSMAMSTTVRNATTITSSYISMGTGTTMARNTTLSTPSLTSTRAVTLTPSVSPTKSENTAPTATRNAAPVLLSCPVTLVLSALAAFACLN